MCISSFTTGMKPFLSRTEMSLQLAIKVQLLLDQNILHDVESLSEQHKAVSVFFQVYVTA